MGRISSLLLLCSAGLAFAAPTPPPPSSSFYVPLSSIPNFHPLPDTPPLHIWAGHLLAEPTNFIPPGPNEDPKPNLEVQSHLYFVLLKARRASDRERLIFWFNGGPGCSSFDGLMMEVGPWRMNEHGVLNQIEGGWEEYANIVYVDQPVGTGYSYGPTEDYVKDLVDVPNPVIEFMRNFFQVFPDMANMETYLAGESYAGQYIPYIADAILSLPPAKSLPMALTGVAIGNGWIDSRAQYPAYIEFALKANLFEENSPEHEYAKEVLGRCQHELDKIPASSNPPGNHVCEEVMGATLKKFHREVDGVKMCMNVYDIRLADTSPACGMNWPPDLKQITPWLRQGSVINALHATHKDSAWHECSGQVGAAMTNKHSEGSILKLPNVANKLNVLIFAGDQDVICNYVGQERMLEKLSWRGETGMGNAPALDWKVDGKEAGIWQTARNVTYVRVYGASHMVGFDLPHVAHDMMLRFMGVNFKKINEGTAAKISSSVGTDAKDEVLPGGGRLTEVQESAKWQAYYNAGTVALIVVIIAVSIGTVLYCRSRRSERAPPGKISLASRDYGNGVEEESIPLNPSHAGESIEESRRRKGKGRATPIERDRQEETMFEIGSDGEEKHP